MKKIICVIVAVAIACFNSAFAYEYISSYKTELAADTFSQGLPLSGWTLYNCETPEVTIDNEDAISVNINKTGHFVRRNFSLVNSGILVCEFDMTVPDASKWTKSFQIGITNSNGTNVPLFALLPSGYLRSSIDLNYTNLRKLDLTGWCTFRIEYDISDKIFKVCAGEKGTELSYISGLANSFYADKEDLNGGVKGMYIVSSSQPALNDAYRLDNVMINAYPKAFEALKAASDVSEAEKILSDYSKAGLIELPEVYLNIQDKNDILYKLINSDLSSDEDVVSIISAGFGIYEEKIYADISDMFNADIIGSPGQKPSGTFGIERSSGWYGDGKNNLRDNYLGQGYNADKIKEKLDKENILKVSNTENSLDFKTVAFNRNALDAGVNDAYILFSSSSKGEDGLYVPQNDMILDLSGKNLSSVDIAAVRGSFNYAFLFADIYYEDGTFAYYEDSANRIPMLGERIKGYYMSDDFGNAVYKDESGALVYDTRTLSTVTNSFDNRSKSYMTVRSIPLDISKKASKIRLYTKSKWGQGSAGVLAVTLNPATNNELLNAVESVADITVNDINPKTDLERIQNAFGCANELMRRGIFSRVDSRYKRAEALLNMCNSYDENFLVMTQTSLFDTNAKETDKLSDAKKISVQLICNNKHTSSVGVTSFAAFYDSELKMLGITDFEHKDIAPGVTDCNFENLDIPEGTEKIYFYVWEDFDTISPYANMTVIGGGK